MKNDCKPKLWTKDFTLICLISLIASSAIQIMNNTTPLYIDSLGGTASYSGSLFTIFTIAAVISRFIIGNLIDSKGYRIFVMGGSVIFALFVITYIILPQLYMFPIWRFMQGLGFAALTTATGAAIADVSHRSRIGEGISIYGLGQSFATAIGPSLGLALIFGNNFSVVYIVASIIIMSSFFLSFGCSFKPNIDNEHIKEFVEVSLNNKAEKTTTGIKSFLNKYFEKKAIHSSIIQGLNSASFSSILIYLALYSADKRFANAGCFFIIASITMIMSRIFLASFVDRYRPIFILIPGLLAGIVCFIILAFTTNPVVYLSAAIGYGIMHGMCTPLLNLIAINNSSTNRRGAATATFYVSVDIGIGLGSSLWGLVIDLAGFKIMYCGATLCVALSIILSFIFFLNNQ